MTHRRHFLNVGAGALATLATERPVQAQNEAQDAKTWLTYAVNVEMFWSNLPFLDRLRKVHEAGFRHYEFWPWRNKDIDAIAALNAELGLHAVQFTGHPPSFREGTTNPDNFEPFVEAIRAAVPVARKLNVSMLCVVAGEETPGLSRERQTEAVIRALKSGAEIVAPHGITLILEPLNVLVDHPRQLVVHSSHAAEIIRAVGSPHVRILFDIYHQQISEGNLTGNIRKYSDLIGYFQLADHPGRHEPGTGEVNYAHVLRVIHDLGHTKPIGLELTPESDPFQALRAVRRADAQARAREKG